jgi:uncharacterized protein
VTVAPAAARGADWKLWVAGGVAGLAIALLGIRAVGYRHFEKQALITPPDAGVTPAAFGAPFADTTLESGTRRLAARTVDAGPGTPVLVLAHGTAEALSDWADVQALWRTMGASSFVFDYSGFGRSTGRASAVSCSEDAVVAYRAARAHFGTGRRFVLVGYSLGTGPVLEVLRSLTPAPDGVALVAGYSSARAGITAFLGTSRVAAFIMPDLWNNVRGARSIPVPLVVVHSADDRTFPIAMADSVAAAGGTTVVRLEGPAHPDGHRHPTREYWASVVSLALGRL